MTTETTNPNKRRTVLIAITALFILAGLAYFAYYKLVLSGRADTDNAYVGGNLVTVSSQVAGSVIEIAADETQMVQAGAEIIKLDPSDAQVALNQAEAKLASVVRQQRERYSNVDQFDAQVAQREIELKAAQDDLARRLPLAADHTVSGEDIAHARRAVDNARAALEVARKQSGAARAGVSGVALAQHPYVLAARADYTAAWLAARRNAIVAPVSGYVAKRSVQVGSRITPGAPLLTIVPLDQLWVEANFKESELRDIRVGQPATVEADMYGGKVTFHGKVLGLSAGTGSAFSLLPAQNASGNWIKVVQRVPVRIALDPKELAEHPLRVGLSATASVDITQKGGALGAVQAPATQRYATTALSQPLEQARAATDAIVAKNLAN
ncbi:efflux RND transporter periplasmic adaptor subunit [Massilia sp. R2A-15]|uniref:HlyD family secretion protein n=1 Tax=Massilia sp. R2A-15 TaxID=3064278 RepID=UPI002736098E|nr:HlyD family efflux transporter periplasmic adaptor subunit [Massilia sp. R2A-15]WLI91351.1 efflux RND transporter periplasmic adaptor subunit [Massilia sp. R2A-15]